MESATGSSLYRDRRAFPGGVDREGYATIPQGYHETTTEQKQESQCSPDTSPLTLVDRLARLPIRRPDPSESILVRPATTYSHRREAHASRQRRHRDVTRLTRSGGKVYVQRRAVPDWRIVLQNLSDWTPAQTPEFVNNSIKVMMPADRMRELVDHLPDVRSRSGTRIELHDGDAADEGYLVVSGMRNAVVGAVEEMLQIAGKMAVVPLAVREESLHVQGERRPYKCIRRAWSPRGEKAGAGAVTVSAHRLPLPREWTRERFDEYIARLTSARPEPNRSCHLHPRNQSHERVVIRQLHAVFDNPDAWPAVSNSAFKLALSYMARRGVTFRPDARALFTRTSMNGLAMDTEVFNILAESFVRERDLGGFHDTVRLMVKRGHQPDVQTWILFLRLIQAEEVRRYILHAMHNRGLFNTPGAVRHVACAMAENDIHRAAELGHDLGRFLADQEALYGPAWLSIATARKIVEQLGRHGRFDEIATLIRTVFATEPARPDAALLRAVIHHCRARNRIDKAVDFLELVHRMGGATPTADIYHDLFQMACRHKKAHMLSVVWRYAVLVGAHSSRMRRRADMLLRRCSLSAAALRLDDDPSPATLQPVAEKLLLHGLKQAGPEDEDHPGNPEKGAKAVSFRRPSLAWQPVDPLFVPLRQAVELDRKNHEIFRGRSDGEIRIEPIDIRTRRCRLSKAGS